MGNLSCESREQNRKDKVTRLRSGTYARQQGLLVNTLGSHLKIRSCAIFSWFRFSSYFKVDKRLRFRLVS